MSKLPTRAIGGSIQRLACGFPGIEPTQDSLKEYYKVDCDPRDAFPARSIPKRNFYYRGWLA
jgi:hypothetical protein